MQITIDLDSLKASGGPFSLKRLDFVPVDLVFKSGGLVVDLPYDAVGKLGVKLAPGNDFLAYTDHWVKEGIGSNAVYTFDVGLNTTATVAALASAPTLNAFIEVEWSTGGYRYFSSSLPISISDNVIAENEPYYPSPINLTGRYAITRGASYAFGVIPRSIAQNGTRTPLDLTDATLTAVIYTDSTCTTEVVSFDALFPSNRINSSGNPIVCSLIPAQTAELPIPSAGSNYFLKILLTQGGNVIPIGSGFVGVNP